MGFKNIMLVILLLLLLAVLTISVVSASEDIISTDNLTESDEGVLHDTSSKEIELSNNADGDLVSSLQNEIIKETDDGTFTALQNMINNAYDGSTINLEMDYLYDDEFGMDGICIDKNLTINGNNHRIDALKKSRIFTINETTSVILNNIQFYNANNGTANGGAIYSSGESLKINNCKFINNNASSGGAVFSYLCKLTFDDCEFVNNSASVGGCLFSVYALTNINNCIFNNNYAELAGGSIFLQKTNSYSLLTAGIYNNAMNTSIRCSKFENNVAGDVAGAIYSEHYLSVVDCDFINNSATSGGAIYTYNGQEQVTSLEVYDRGAYAYTTTSRFTQRFVLNISGKTIFKKNNADDGGAIRINADEDYVFRTPSIYGTLILDEGVVFDSNNASYGGAISISSTEANITGVKFTNNNANYGGAFYSEVLSTVLIDNSTFIDNFAIYCGESIKSEYFLNVTNSNFYNQNSDIEFIYYENFFDINNGEIVYYGGFFEENNQLIGHANFDIYYDAFSSLDFKTKLIFKNQTAIYGDIINLGGFFDTNGNSIAVNKMDVIFKNLSDFTDYNVTLNYNETTKSYNFNSLILNEDSIYVVSAIIPKIAKNCEIINGTLKFAASNNNTNHISNTTNNIGSDVGNNSGGNGVFNGSDVGNNGGGNGVFNGSDVGNNGGGNGVFNGSDVGNNAGNNISSDTNNSGSIINNTSFNDFENNTQSQDNISSITEKQEKDVKFYIGKFIVKKSAKKAVLKVTVKVNNLLLKSKYIKIKFKGKTYKLKTNKKGVAKLVLKKKVLKKLKAGKKVKYQIIYGDETVKKSVKVKK